MKQIQIILLVLFCAFTGFNAAGQANANLNILTLNSGQVNQGAVVDLQVSVGNTGPGDIGVNKVRAQISIPIAIATALPTAQQTGLPSGWIVTVNSGASITVCNGTDVIPAGEQRQVFIKIQGTAVGGPSTINGSLSFGPGSGVCTGPGSLPGDNTADNTSTSSITVLPAAACNLALSAAAGTIACNGGTTTLTATATGAAGAVEYSLNGGSFQASNLFTVNAAGSPYTVTARESGNTSCTASATPVTVTEPAAITASASAGTINCFGGTTTLTVTASGGTAPLQYSIDGGTTFQPGNTFTVSTTGSPFTVTVKDANNCTATTNAVTVTQPTQLTATASSTPVSTIGGSDGTATAVPVGGTSPYSYSWTPGGQTTVTASGLTAGSYTVTITDANGCTTTATATVGSPSCSVTASAVAGPAIQCNAGTTTLTVTATGAAAPVQYSIDGGTTFQPSNVFTVGAGTYTATVKDANNCTATTSPVTITQPTAVVVGATAQPIALPGGTTTVTITATGGTAPYTGTGSFVRSAGTYTFTVTDANGCTGSTTLTLSDPVAGNANATLNILTLNSGQVNLNGVVDLQVSVGNTGPSFIGVNKVRAQISIPIAIATALPNAQQTGLPAGWIILTNTGGTITICNGTDQIPSGEQRQLFIKIQGTTAGGPSTINGSLSFGPGSGVCTGPGSLSGDNTADNTSTSSITVISTCSLAVSASAGTIACNAGTTTLTATATGAAGTVEYSLNGGAFQPGNTFTVNAAGSPYIVTAREVATIACSATSAPVTVTEPTAITASASAGAIACFGGTITLTVTATGGTGAYQYSLNGGTFQSGNTFTVNAAGSPYTVTARDANLCTGTTSPITVSEPSAIIASASAGIIACNGGTTTLTATVSGGTGSYQYSLNGGSFQAGNTFTVNAAGSPYTITVRDVNFCTTTTNTVTVTEPSLLSATATSTPVTTAGGSDGTATAVPAGGTAPYSYSWNPGGQTTVTATGLTAGSYTVTVTDSKGCTTTASTTVGSPNCNISASASAPAIACPGGTTTLTVTVTGATAPVQYSLNGGTFQPGNTFTVNAAGSPYTVSVKDANLCTATTNAVTVTTTPDNTNPTITAPAALNVNTNSGCTATGINLGTPVTADNCSVASVTNNAPAAFPLGTTTVTWTVTDGSGNTATATQLVTVTDNINPVIYFQGTGLTAGTTGTSSSATPYLLPTIPGVKFKSIISVNDLVGTYRMVGIPDGLGAFDNNNGTFTLLVNHELTSGVGINRAHGSKGAFVSKWIINKSTLSVLSGSDLMQNVYLWNTGTSSYSLAGANAAAFSRFCSADLPPVSAFYNRATGMGTQERIFMNGEENNDESRGMAHIVTGANAGTSYELPALGKAAWENSVANPATGNKTVVAEMNDGTDGQVYFYIGTKTNTGTEIEKAGLTNGHPFGVKVTGFPVERNSTSSINNPPAAGTHFDLVDLGDVRNITGAAFNTLSNTNVITKFSRPEDGAWDPLHPADFYFNTTDQIDQVSDGLGTQVGRSRVWRLRFTDILNPELGGTIEAVVDGTEGINMLDNMAIDSKGHILLQEDVGNSDHLGKIWQYNIATDALTMIASHDPARFGNVVAGVTTPATAPFNKDEESSGVIDVSEILGPGMFLTTVQAHYAPATNTTEVVEGGQLLAFFNPASISVTPLTAAADTIRACFGTPVNLGSPATADNCSVASVTNDAPATFPVGNTTVTWTVTDGSGNTATATQVVVITTCNTPLTATYVKNNLSVCGGSNDGSITVTASGGLAPYTYSWTGETGSNHTLFTAGNVSSITGLNYGFYNVTVTDANLNTFTISNIHVEFAYAVFVTSTGSVSSSCGNTGSIILYGNAGVQPYTFSINGTTYQAGNTFTGLAAGTYTGYVKDAAGCISTKPNIVIGSSAPVTVTTFTRAASSCANDGSVEIFRSGGIPPYTYSLDGVIYQVSNVFTGLAAGTYTATVKDSKGCIGSQPAVVTQGAGLSVTASKTNTSSCINDGTIQANVTGGVAPYTYSINGTTFQASNAFASLAAGPYTITVKDSKGCSGTANVTIATNSIVVTAFTVNASNCATSNGSIQLYRTGGFGPYTYSINGNSYQASSIFNNIAAGTYTGYVKDSKGCVGMLLNIVVGPSCNPLVASTPGKGSVVISTSANNALKIQAYPNPSVKDFTLALEGFNSKEPVTVTVTDVLGRIVYQTSGPAKLQYKFGSNFIAGIYNVQVIQDNEMKSLKLVKE